MKAGEFGGLRKGWLDLKNLYIPFNLRLVLTFKIISNIGSFF